MKNSLFNLTSSMQDLSAAIRNLTTVMADVPRHILVTEAFQRWPHSMPVYDKKTDKTASVDTRNFEFLGHELLAVWDNINMEWWLERCFNEVEAEDAQGIRERLIAQRDYTFTIPVFSIMAESYLDEKYPGPSQTPFLSFNGYTMEEKHYYMPTLKVLNRDSDGMYWSPVYTVPWVNDELLANHEDNMLGWSWSHDSHSIEEAMGMCDCGIYGSINLNELHSYYVAEQNALNGDHKFTRDDHRLCIIEPYSDATVWVSRKGWKASKAFISEVVGETISVPDASTLLSMVWSTPLDLSTIFKPELT